MRLLLPSASDAQSFRSEKDSEFAHGAVTWPLHLLGHLHAMQENSPGNILESRIQEVSEECEGCVVTYICMRLTIMVLE